MCAGTARQRYLGQSARSFLRVEIDPLREDCGISFPKAPAQPWGCFVGTVPVKLAPRPTVVTINDRNSLPECGRGCGTDDSGGPPPTTMRSKFFCFKHRHLISRTNSSAHDDQSKVFTSTSTKAYSAYRRTRSEYRRMSFGVRRWPLKATAEGMLPERHRAKITSSNHCLFGFDTLTKVVQRECRCSALGSVGSMATLAHKRPGRRHPHGVARGGSFYSVGDTSCRFALTRSSQSDITNTTIVSLAPSCARRSFRTVEVSARG